MVIPITLDLVDIAREMSLDKKQVDQMIDYSMSEIAKEFEARWRATASRELTSTRGAYLSSLSVVDEGLLKSAVVLDYSQEKIVRMIEEGATAFDMKLSFAQSDKKVEKEDGGWYLTIPFSVGSTGTTKENFSTIMPKKVYDIAKTKEFGQSVTKRDLEDIPDGIPEPKPKPRLEIPKTNAFKDYERKGSIYEGITRTKDKGTGNGTYTSFRRVSDNSDEGAWIHPGMEAKNLAEKTYNEFKGTMSNTLTDIIDNALFNLKL